MEYMELASVRMDMARTKNPEIASPLKENSNMDEMGKENRFNGSVKSK
jgi:hypothetical protein